MWKVVVNIDVWYFCLNLVWYISVCDDERFVCVCLFKMWIFVIGEWNNVCGVYLMGVIISWSYECSFWFSVYVWWFGWVEVIVLNIVGCF